MHQHSLTILGTSLMYQVSLIHNFVWQKMLYHLTISRTKCDLIILNGTFNNLIFYLIYM